MHGPTAAPSASGSVVLNLGPGIGALVLHTPQELGGTEIEISLADGDPAQVGAQARGSIPSAFR